MTSRKPAGAGHSGTTLRKALSLVLDLSKHLAGKALGLEPETRPLSTGPPGSGHARSRLDARGAPQIAPGLHAGERKACLSGPPPALRGFGTPTTPHPPGSRAAPPGKSRQPTADLPMPVLAGTGGWLPTHGFPCSSACRESSPTSKGKTHRLLKRGFSRAGRKGGPPTPSLHWPPWGGGTGPGRHVRPSAPRGHSLTWPPDHMVVLASVLGLGAGQAEGLAD